MSKILVAAASAAGYVLGTKAGRERYEMLRQKADELLQRPEVQPWKHKLEEAIGTGSSPQREQTSAAEPAYVTRAEPYPSPAAPLSDPSPRPSGVQ
jgi:hypothetical protein